MAANTARQLPVGAELTSNGVHFRVWAPDHDRVDLVMEQGDTIGMEPEPEGYFSAFVEGLPAGALYRFRLSGRESYPDPASRAQPHGPHGASQVVDASRFPWTDASWRGAPDTRHVIYELHVGTFTRAGTWNAAAEQLEELAALGISMIEIMPIAEFPGRYNWGYDGVALFAPAHVYGTPDDFRAFVDRAHALNIAVILDVVYNHMGPDGCYMPAFASAYFSQRHHTDWGQAINFDGEQSAAVREFFLANVAYWIREFHLDGLRLDATQNIYDDGTPHILAEVVRVARETAGDRNLWIVAENESQDTRLVRPPEDGGFGLDALWNDDFHHTALVALGGRTEAYYSDYRGTPAEFVAVAKYGFLFQGQYYAWQKQRRGTPTRGLSGRAFVNFIDNHDQISNSLDGKRAHELSDPGDHRALTALMYLMPGHVMLFQGQEFNASAPFLFFADHEPELAKQVHAGRREFMLQFESAASAEMLELIPDPADPLTFAASHIDLQERARNGHALQLHRDLIRLTRDDAVLRSASTEKLDGAVLSDEAFVLRYFADHGDDRLVLVSLGVQDHFDPAPEPLLAPPLDREWHVLWSSDDPDYGGRGIQLPEQDDGWHIPAHACVVLAPRPRSDGPTT